MKISIVIITDKKTGVREVQHVIVNNKELAQEYHITNLNMNCSSFVYEFDGESKTRFNLTKEYITEEDWKINERTI